MPTPTDPPPLLPAAPFPPALPDFAMVQLIKDNEHLRLLSMFHYVVGGLAILFSSLFIFHIFFGVMMLSNSRFFETSPTVSYSVSSPIPGSEPGGAEAAPTDPAPASTPTLRPRMHGQAPPAFFGYMMVGLGSFVVLIGWSTGALLIYSGRCLARRTRRMFSMVVAGISCLQVPFGTILGVFTLVALQRPSVKVLYGVGARDAGAASV